MLLKLVVPIAFSLLLHSSTVATNMDRQVAQLPPNCSYNIPNDYRYVRCEGRIPDFASFNPKWLNLIEVLTIGYGCTSANIGRQTFQHLPKLRQFLIDCSEIKTPDEGAFVDTAALIHVEILGNAVAFPLRLFCNVKALRTVNVQNNQLSSDLAFGLGECSNGGQQQQQPQACENKIEKLFALDNKMTSLRKDGFLCNLGSLTFLHLQNNSIGSIEKEAFLRVPHLQILYLSDNGIKQLPVDTFQFANQLVTLNLARNKLTHLLANIFKPTPKLKNLELTGNLFGVLTEGAFNSLRATNVYLSQNRISRINGAFRNASANILNLDNNRFEVIDRYTFYGLLSVRDLKLSYNSIRTIADNVFAQFPRLKTLDLSNNRLKDISRIGVPKSIDKLYTDYNDFKSNI